MKKILFSIIISILLLPCLFQETNKTQQNELNETLHSKSIFPIDIQGIIGSLYLSLVIGFAISCGIGGGAVFLTTLVYLFGMAQERALPLSFVIMLFGSLSNAFYLTKEFDKKTGESIINQDIALICVPMILIGTMIGVKLSMVLPTIIPAIGLVGILIYSFKKSYGKYKTESDKETKEEKKVLKKPLLDANKNLEENIQKQVENQLPWDKIKYMIIIIVAQIAIGLIAGGKQMKSVIGIEYCGVIFWIIFWVIFLGGCAFGYDIYKKLQDSEIAKNKEQAEAIKQRLKIIFSVGFIAGLCGGLVGLGGGFIMVPVFSAIGISVRSSSATSGFTIVFTALSAVFQGVIADLITLDSFLYFAVLGSVSSYLVVTGINWYLNKQKRQSVLLIILMFFLAITMIMIPISMIQKMIENPDIILKFKSFC